MVEVEMIPFTVIPINVLCNVFASHTSTPLCSAVLVVLVPKKELETEQDFFSTEG